MNFTGQKIYLVKVDDPSERVILQFPPEQINNDRSVDIAKVKAVGRNNPVAQATSGDESLSFSLVYFADDGDFEKVKKNANWVKSLSYERPKVKFIMGSLYDDFEFYVSSVKITYEKFVSGSEFMPMFAKIDLTLQIANTRDFTSAQIKKM